MFGLKEGAGVFIVESSATRATDHVIRQSSMTAAQSKEAQSSKLQEIKNER